MRSRDWIKIRHVLPADVIVGGWLPGGGRLAGRPGAVLVGEHHGGELRYVGSVGTGWSDRERVQLAELLRVAAWPECPFRPVPRITGARWVLPRLVAEIGYATRTRAGYLRHPSWHGCVRTWRLGTSPDCISGSVSAVPYPHRYA